MKSYLREVVYGLVLALATVVWLWFEYAIGLHTKYIAYHAYLTNLFAIIPIALMWHAIKYRRDVLEGGELVWWQGMMSGMVISVVTGALGAPTIWIFTHYINPNFFAAMIEYTVRTGYYAKTEHAESYFNFAGYAIQATLFPIISGFFTALILTAIAQRQIAKKNQAKTTPA